MASKTEKSICPFGYRGVHRLVYYKNINHISCDKYALVGDNIGGLLSLRYFEDGNFNVVLLDDALVSFTYRRSNIFYQLIDGALKFLLSMLSSSEALIFQKLRITISPDAKSGWQDNKLQSEGFQLNSLFDGTREYDMDVNYHTLLQIAQYIRSKI